MGKYILFIRNISFFAFFFASKLNLLVLYFVKKILKRKLVLPLRWGLKQRCLSVSESEASMGYFHNNLDFKNLFKRLICYGSFSLGYLPVV